MPVFNYPLPDHCYSDGHQHRATLMAPQRSSGSTDSNWSNSTSASYPSHSSSQHCPPSRHAPSTQGSSQHPFYDDSRRQTLGSQYRAPSSPSEKSDRESKEIQYCPHEDCRDSNGRPNRPFSRKADVSRHYKTTHDKQPVDCPKPRCARKGLNGFTRQDHLVEHLRGYHGENIAKRQACNSGSPGRYP